MDTVTDSNTSRKEENEALQVEAPRADEELHADEASPADSVPGAGEAPAPPLPPHDADAACVQCGEPIGAVRGAETVNGPLHHNCVLTYRFLHQPRCHYCGIRFLNREATEFVKDEDTGKLFHQNCHAQFKAGVPFVKPTKEGELKKFSIARSKLSRKNWKTRYFILSPAMGGLRYYESNPSGDAADKGKGKSKSDGDSSASGDDDVDEDIYDPDADPDREACLNNAKSKGEVPLDERSRLVTRPAMSNYKIDSPSASDRYDIGILFYESKESSIERRLIIQCKDAEEYKSWVRALEAYIYIVDDPDDYKSKEKKEDKKDKKDKKDKGKDEKSD